MVVGPRRKRGVVERRRGVGSRSTAATNTQREKERDLRALLASNSKRARATCLEYSLVIFPPVSLFSLSLSLFLPAGRLTPERYFICKEAACRSPLPLLLISRAQECLSSKIPRYRTMTARESGIKGGRSRETHILLDFYLRFLPITNEVSFVRLFDGFISRLCFPAAFLPLACFAHLTRQN